MATKTTKTTKAATSTKATSSTKAPKKPSKPRSPAFEAGLAMRKKVLGEDVSGGAGGTSGIRDAAGGIFLAVLSTDAGWTLIDDEAGIKTYFRQEDNGPLVTIKVKAVFDCAMLDIVTLFNEVTAVLAPLVFLTGTF